MSASSSRKFSSFERLTNNNNNQIKSTTKLPHTSPHRPTTTRPQANEENQSLSSRLSAIKKMRHRETSKRLFDLKACISLAVILYTSAAATLAVQNVNADQSDNSQLVPHHSSHSQNALFKDLSGPTSGKIQTLDVICGKNFMTVRAEFSGPFYGIVFSKGTYGQENCIYVKPNSGLTHAAFNVYYDQCGTKPDLQGKFYENTIVIQYGSDIIEAYDEAKRLRCEWFEAYEKPATFKPAIPVADLEVVEMNFQGDDIDCWMEIQEGSGPWSREVSKIVPVGQPMTIVVAINDYNGQFDMRVKSCVAHDGVQQPISLTDEFGCVLRPKMLTPFTKIKNPGGHKKATVLSYSRFLAFKFPDSMQVQIQCTVEVCRHGCADACQRVPSIAATTLQPELSLTAKWPSSPNQAAIEGPVARPPPPAQKRFQESQQVAVHQPVAESFNDNVMNAPPPSGAGAYKPPVRVQFSQRQPTESYPSGPQRLPAGLSAFHSTGNELALPDDMSISDSNQQASIINQPQQQQQQQRRSPNQQPQPEPSLPRIDPQRRDAREPSLPSMIDGRVPQYLVPNSNRRRQTTTQAALPSSTTTTSTTTSAPTTTQAQPEDNRASPADEAPEYSSSDELLTRLNSAQNNPDQASKRADGDISGEQAGATSAAAAAADSAAQPTADNKQEASQVKPTMALPSEQPSDQQQSASNSGDNSPVVEQNDSNQKAPSQAEGDAAAETNKNQDMESSGSSLKTVEVEIPANEDPVRTLISSSPPSGSGNQMQNFNSVRMSNVDLSNNGYGYETNNQDNNRDQELYKQQQGYVNEQVIQPRENQASESSNKRDKSDDQSNIEAMMANVKQRFGARSQPQQSNVIQSSVDNQQPSIQLYNNHQMSSVDQIQEVPMRDGAEVVNPDRVLIDRSDDSSTLTEVASSSASDVDLNSNNNKPDSSVEESSPVASVDNTGSNGKVKPVVGTEELATGPLQIEDRMGAPAPQDSLEEALMRVQQPQSAALVGDIQRIPAAKEQKPSQATGSEKPESRSDSAPAVPAAVVATAQASEKPDLASDRVDVGADNKRQSESNGQQRIQPKSSSSSSEISQPFPNIHGQQKVIPDPSSSLNTRHTLMAQASNQDGSSSSVVKPDGTPSNPQASMQRPADGSQPIMHQQIMSSKPVAQITNVPINIGFPQSQIPAIQQLSHQLAYFQQQQQQQQQQQLLPKITTTTTTVKPSRGRFSLLSPQAALQAVASRFLPKSAQQQQQQQFQKQQSQLSIAQLPQQVFNNIKLTSQQQQQQIQQQSPKYFLQQTQPAQQQQQQIVQQYQQQPGRFAIPTGQQLAQTGANPMGSGLFGRLNNVAAQQQQPQALIRSRRSAMMPNGKRGSGEVGITKTFMVVTGMDLAFLPNATDTELPPILEGRRLVEDDVIYGVCMPVVSLTFVLTCAFWLIVFIFSFCVYMLMKSRRQHQQRMDGSIEKQ